MAREEVWDIDGARRNRREEERRDVLCARIFNRAHRRRYLVNFLVLMFGFGSCVSLNGIVAELPLLVKSAPEGSALPSNLSVAALVAYVGPALYALFRKSAAPLKIRHEFIWISSVLFLGTVTMLLFAFFHDVTITINAVGHSAAMLFFIFVLASVNSSRNVLLLPYLRHIEEVNLTSFFIGEGLSGFIPSIVALIQGVGGDPACPNSITNSADQPVSYVVPPNFSSRDFFLFIAALLATSIGAFWLLEYMRVKKLPRKEDATFHHDRDSAEERKSFRKLLDPENMEKSREIEMMDAAELTSAKSDVAAGNGVGKTSTIYLCTLMWLACLIAHGYLNSMETYSSRPYGNSAYHLVANLSQLAGTVACALTFWLPPLSTRGTTVVMSLVLVAATYVTWLALCSPMPPWRDTTYGPVLLITIWVILISLVSYAKLAITAIVWQQSSDAGLYQLAFANLAGSGCSAILIFFLVNFTELFTPYAACEVHV